MSSTDARPTLLPGVSARSWQLVLQIAVWVSVAATAVTVLLNVFIPRVGSIIVHFIPVIAAYVLVYAVMFVSGARAKREVAAGYTTLQRANPTVPQLDAKSGELLRRAGEPYLAKPQRRTATVGDNSSPIFEPSRRPSRWIALRSFWYLPLIAAVATYGLFARSGWLNPAGFVWLPLAFAAFIALIAISFLVVGLSALRTLAQVRKAAPGELVFVFSRSKTLWPALNEAGWTRSEVPLATGLAVSADTRGVTVWEDGPATSGLTVPWSRVVSIQADDILTGNQTRPGVLITLTAPDGDLVAVPFANANSDSFPLVSKAGVDYLVAELNQLRTAQTSARLI